MNRAKILAIVALLAAPTWAVAQPSGAQAESLFRQGKDLMTKGRIAEACAAFDASQKLDPTISTLLNQASCREKNGQLATAWGLFLEAERLTRPATDEQARQLHQVAASHAAKLEPRLSTLTIHVPTENRVPGLQVLRDAHPVDPGAWNKALPLDGGTYKVTATAPGNADWSTTITIENDHDAKTIEIPKLKAAELRPSQPTAAAPAEPVATPPSAGSRSKLVPLVLGGTALVLAGGAIGFELSARSTYDKSLEADTNAERESLWSSAINRRHVAQGLGVASVACAGLAVWLYLRASTEASPPAREARVQLIPVVNDAQVGLLVTGGY